MSHYSYLDLVVLDKTEIPAYFGEKIAAILLGEEINSLASATENVSALKRSMTGSTRSDSFKWRMGELLKLAAIDSLSFIAETACSHLVLKNSYEDIMDATSLEFKKLDEDEDEDAEFNDAYFYTVIKPEQCEALLADLAKLLAWCSHNLSPASDVLEFDDEDVQNAIETAVVCENLNNEAHYGEDGDSAEFFFCALKSIQELLQYAKANNLYAIYENNNGGLGLEYLEKHPPQIIGHGE